MWIIWNLVAALILTIGYHHFSDKSQYHWLELLGQFLICFLVAFGVGKISLMFKSTDTEYWGDLLDRIVYEGAYEEWEYNPCCTTYECKCTTDKDGNRSCDTCCDGCWECNTYGPYRYKIGRSGQKYSIGSQEYKRTLKSLGYQRDKLDVAATNNRHSKLNQTSFCNRDDKIFRADWDGDTSTVENIVSEHSYENKIRYSNSVYGYDKPSDQIAEDMGLVMYNRVRDHYQPDVHGALSVKLPGYTEAVRKLSLLNGRYGKVLQLKAMVFVIPYKEDALFWQEQYLEGGNKNEFIVALAVDSTGSIKEYRVISWTEAHECTNSVNNWLHQYKGNDLEEIVDFMTPVLKKSWVRREFTSLNEFVSLEPDAWVILLGIILQAGIGFGLFRLFQENYFDQDSQLI